MHWLMGCSDIEERVRLIILSPTSTTRLSCKNREIVVGYDSCNNGFLVDAIQKPRHEYRQACL
jgi:hypothetical protein